MKNTTTPRIILTLCAVCFCLVTQAQATLTDFQQDLTQAFTNGNALQITKSIGETALITVEDEERLCSKTQAEYVLKSFFSQHPSGSFVIHHTGELSDGTKYLLGEYSRIFSVRAVVKLLDEEYRLIDLTIEHL